MPLSIPTVWLIDDDPDAHFLLKRAFQRSGVCHSPVSFLHPTQALEAFRQLVSHQESMPQLCVVDMSMPTYDGITCIEQLEQIAQQNQYPPFYTLLLSNALPVGQESRLASCKSLLGMREKPLNTLQLSDFMEHQWPRP